ncbi:MAG: TIGR03808 family TAT-translocated repetitive protein [Rhizobiaceae bacterium]|nr:TIGR03808 family TAT-translocated repetitive protein [Rhizobiaceae bacterium]
MISRRKFVSGLGAIAAISTTSPALGFTGGWRAFEHGVRPGAAEDQGLKLQKLLEKASLENQPVFLEPGQYIVSNLTLPRNTRLYGVKGATTLQFLGGDHFLYAENSEVVDLRGLTFDGRLRPVKEYADGNVRISNAKSVTIEHCHLTNASAYGLIIDRSEGIVSSNQVENALGFGGIMSMANTGLTISHNTVQDCANAGILAYRWERGEDNTIIANNRVRRIASIKGGTGQHGNGINSYQCDGIMITDNHISDCAFSTVRSNSCSNIQITNNTCLRAGETSIYSEFAFQGANITGNIVDGAARGISIANLDHGGRLSICANNLVRNIHESVPYADDQHIFGIGILAEADIAITGNVVENTKRFGMLLGWGPYLQNVVASNNVVRKTKTGFYVSVVEGIGTASITDNVISETSRGGVIGHRWQEAVTNDLSQSNNKDYPTLQIQRNKLDS